MGYLRAHEWVVIAAVSVALVAGVACLMAMTSLFRAAHDRTRRSRRQADVWCSIAEAAQCVRDGNPPQSLGMTSLISHRSTRRLGIEALADMARAMPDTNLVGWISRSTRRRIEVWFSQELKEPDPGRRANALEIAGTLKLMSSVGLIARAAHDPSPIVRVAACRSLAVLDPQAVVGILLGTIETDGAWAADLLQDVVARAGPEVCGPVMERFRLWAATPSLLAVLAKVSGSAKEPLLLSALGSSDEAIVERAIEVLALSEEPSAGPAFVRLLGSPSERVRLAAIKALERIALPGSCRAVMMCIGDPCRPVRFAAASAIASHPAGKPLLDRLVRSSDLAVAEAAYVGLAYLNSETSNADDFRYAGDLDVKSANWLDDMALLNGETS